VAYEIAQELEIPLDVVVSRKIGAPYNPEFAIGAISENGASYYNETTLSSLGIDPETLEEIENREYEELRRRIEVYRKGRDLPGLEGKTILLVDDGLATGATARSAIRFLKTLNPAQVLFVAPVCAYDSSRELKEEIDQLTCILRPKALSAIGAYYQDFGQTSDEKVLELLEDANRLI
jgi:predicted phosphoribosyltransferase